LIVNKEKKKRTFLLTAVVVINYIWAGILFIAGVFTFILLQGLSYLYDPERIASLNLLILVVVVVTLLWVILTFRLQKFHNPARILIIAIWGLIGFFTLLLSLYFLLGFLGLNPFDYPVLGMEPNIPWTEPSIAFKRLFWLFLFLLSLLVIYPLTLHKESMQLFPRLFPGSTLDICLIVVTVPILVLSFGYIVLLLIASFF
jgi:hypothetical protein